MVTKALLALMEAKPDKGDEVAEFLAGALELVNEEAGTISWYAIRFTDTMFSIFDAFEGDEGRQAHLNGKVAAALMERADELFVEAPNIQQADILASK